MRNSTPRFKAKLLVFLCFLFALPVFTLAQEGSFVNIPSSVMVEPGGSFTVLIEAQTGGSLVNGAEVHLNFDPTVLRVANVNVLTTELPIPIGAGSDIIDNGQGQLSVIRGAFGAGAGTSEDFDFFEVDFQVIGTGTTTISYNRVLPRRTNMVSGGFSILATPESIPVTIAAQTEDPIASFTASPTSGTADLLVSVDASSSSDPDGGNIVSYEWDFGDTNTATGVTADNNYTQSNIYTITLTVTDDEGETATATQNITVNGITIPSYSLTASAGPNGSIEPESVTVDEGGSQNFTITPEFGYEIADVVVGTTSVGAVASYDFVNVQADATISATFTEIPPFQLCIASGSSGLTAFGRTFEQDNSDTGPTAHPTRTNGKKYAGYNDPILGTALGSGEELLFQKEIYGGGGNNPNFMYDIPVLDGFYQVDLYFAEIYHATAGNRVFDVLLEGNLILDEYEIVDPVKDGISTFKTAITRTYYVNVQDGSLQLGIGPASADNGKLSGICVTSVASANVHPITNIGDLNFDAMTAVVAPLNITDADNDQFTITFNGMPTSLTYNATTNQLEGTPTVAEVGIHTVNAIISDGTSSPVTEEFELVINPPVGDAPPTIDPIADVAVDEGEALSIPIIVTDDNDPSATIKIFDVSAGGTNDPFSPTTEVVVGVLNGSAGNYTFDWTPAVGAGRSYLARVTADDGINLVVVEEFKIDVTQQLSGPILARTFNNPLPFYGGGQSGAAGEDFSVAIETNGNIGYIEANDYVEYLINVPSSGDYDVRFNSANGSGANGSSTDIELFEEGNAIPIGTITVPKTIWTDYNNYTKTVTFASSGVQMLRLAFNGGVNTTEFQFTPSTSNTAPIVTIDTPSDGLTVDQGSAIKFTATAEDTQDSDVAASLVWNSDIDGDFGTGANVNTSALSTGTHTITATATDNDPTVPLTGSASITVSINQTAPACDVRFRVNAGGAMFASSTGDFEEDQTAATVNGTAQSGTPSPYLNLTAPAVDKTFGATAPLVTNTTGYPDALFQTERYSDAANPNNMQWSFPTGDGIYDVKILFNENWTGEINNPRVFDVEIEGEIALDDYRPSGSTGADVNVAKVETYQATVTDGVLNINFLKGTQNPAVKGFDICFVAPVSDSDPVVTITEPADGAIIDRNVATTFTGFVTDVEDDDALLTSVLTWNSATDPSFSGTGGTFSDVLLAPGTHVLQATVTDSDNNTVSESITVTVPGPEVAFTSPAEGAVLDSPEIRFEWTALNMLLTESFGEHFHLYVNPADPDNLDSNDRISTASEIRQLFWELGITDGIVEGENTVVIVAAESLHTEFSNPEAKDIVNFTVCSTAITSITANNPTDCELADGELLIVAEPSAIIYEYSIDNGQNFQADNNFTDLAAGIYDIVVRPLGGAITCSATDTVTLTGPETPSITEVVSTDLTDCTLEDGQIEITASGTNLEYSINNGDTFQIANTFTGLAAGSYDIVVREADATSCTAITTVTLEDSLGTTPIITGPTTYLQGSGGVTLDAGAGYASYLWSPGGETAQTITALAGTYSVTVTEANGCEGTSIGIIVIEESDNNPPQAICQNISVKLDETGNGSITAADIDNGSNDTSGIASLSLSESTFTCSNLGANQVTLTVMDNNGNSSNCIATVTVQDDIDPIITCPANIEMLSSSSQVLEIIAATATDNCDNPPAISFLRSDNENLGLNDPFIQGITTIQWTATDASGNTDTCLQTITISLPQSTANDILAFSVDGQVGSESIDSNAGTVNLTVAIGTDITSLAPEIEISDAAGIAPVSGTPRDFSDSQTPVIYTVTAQDGSSKEWGITVTVEDDVTDPEINCPLEITVNNDPGLCGAVVSFEAPVGMDNLTGVTTQRIEGLASGELFPVGITTQTYVATDAEGNSASCSFTVTVLDAEIPIVACPEDISMTVASGITSGVVDFVGPSISDNCPGSVLTQTAGLPSGSDFPVGVTVNIFQVTDASGNTATCSFEVTIDGDPLCSDVEVTVQTATDPTGCGRSDGSIVLNVTGSTGNLDYDWGHDPDLESATATGLSEGSYSVTVTVAGCTKTVSVNLTDPSAPSVTLAPLANTATTASPITLTGGSPVGGTYSGPGVSNGIFAPSIGVGTYSIVYTFEDAATGCSGTATRSITVTAPVIDSPLIVLNANTDIPLFALTDGLKIQKADIGNTPLGIVFDPASNPAGVSFKLTGPISRTSSEGVAPFSLFGDFGVDIQGRVFPIGKYILVADPTNGPTRTVNFEITDVDPLCAGMNVTVQAKTDPTTCAGSNGSIDLMVTGATGPLDYNWSHDATLESPMATGLSARKYTVTVTDANGCSVTVSSTLNEPAAPTVTLSPLANVSDDAGVIVLNGGSPVGGIYSGASVSNGIFDPSIGAGSYAITYRYTDPVTGCDNSAVRNIRVTSTSVLSVSSFTLINADTDEDILNITSGMAIDVSSFSTLKLDIRANATLDVESVRLELSGAKTNKRTENIAPYALYGDSPTGNYIGSNFTVGAYTIKATPYTGNGLKGTKGATETLSFTLVQGVSTTAKTAGRMRMYPNPAIDRTTVSFPEPVKLTEFFVYDVTGRLVKTIASETAEDIESIELSVYDLPIGTYFLRTTDTKGKGFQQRLIIEK